ncbi:hypothetical protein [Flavobacterium oreochromis]|uniref:Uncharacterized protein n=1 Tax=Flavobacterium columnare TaxID=996 RepID=A0A246G888_9FLAO|nr:hypothetical protein [Flavobacterium oreochromis]OWP75015.1 hypothetical protein BWK62_12975 [Flavobacterium oreochromis]
MKTIMHIVFFIFLALTCCHNKKNDETKKSKKMNQLKKEYFLNHKFGNLTYQIYINDLLIANSYNGNGIPGPYEINPYLFSSGIQKLRIKISAPSELGKEYLSPKDIENLEKKTFISLLENENFDDIRIIKEINFQSIKEKQSFIEQEWTFEVDITNEVNNLDKSQNLTTIDKEKLRKDVVNKYEELKQLLNEGNGTAFINELNRPLSVVFKSEYMSEEEQLEYKKNLEKYFNSHKGIMNSISNFTIRIMGNGKAIALEYATGKYKGLGILSSKDIQHKTLNKNYIILHKPIDADKFEIFRYNCSYTALLE